MNYRSQKVFEAVCEIVPKSEQLGREVLIDAYVNMGHAEKCLNATHQYIDGRRGTGKTHLLGYLAESVNANIRNNLHCAVYIDTRNLMIESGDQPGPKVAARRMFQELILAIADKLREIASRELWQNDVPTARSDWEKRIAEQSHEAIDTLYRAAIVGVDRPVVLGESTTTEIAEAEQNSGVSMEIGVTDGKPSGHAKGLLGWLSRAKSTTESQRKTTRRISYVEIRQAIESFLDVNGLERLYLLVDEWAFVASDVQPHFADLLKRTFLPSEKIALKVATLPFQTKFSLTEGRETVGFERNGDIYLAIDLDADLVYQRNPERTQRVLSAVLYKHLLLALHKVAGGDKENNIVGDFPPTTEALTSSLITESAHVRLLKFSHGNPRDYLTIFKKAFISWREGDAEKINVDHVHAAARDFGAEKLEAIKEHQPGSELFRGIVKEVLQGKHQGVFMVRERFASSMPLQYLVHNRVLHVYDRSYSSPTYPGERFVVLAIDYSVVVDHLNAPNYRHILQAPDAALAEARAEGAKQGDEIADWVTKLLSLQDPDRRRVRNTVLPDHYLEKAEEAITCPHCGRTVDKEHPVTRKFGACQHCGESLPALK